jgi:hypothetical protein
MRVQADRWRPRWLLLALAILAFTAHTVALVTPTASTHSGHHAAPVVVALQVPPCEASHASGGAHESCAELVADHCPTSLTGSNGFTATPDGLVLCGSPVDMSTGAIPRSAQRAVSLAQLQVWRH